MKRWLFLFFAILLFAVRPASAADTLTSAVCAAGTTSSAGCSVITVSGFGTVGIQITGTFSGTLAFEATNDDTTWVVVSAYKSTDPTTAVTTTTTTGLYSIPVSGIKRVRVRFSAHSSGSAVVSNIRSDARFWSPGGGSGNPFDQDLNTTDTPTFDGVLTSSGFAPAYVLVNPSGNNNSVAYVGKPGVSEFSIRYRNTDSTATQTVAVNGTNIIVTLDTNGAGTQATASLGSGADGTIAIAITPEGGVGTDGNGYVFEVVTTATPNAALATSYDEMAFTLTITLGNGAGGTPDAAKNTAALVAAAINAANLDPVLTWWTATASGTGASPLTGAEDDTTAGGVNNAVVTTASDVITLINNDVSASAIVVASASGTVSGVLAQFPAPFTFPIPTYSDTAMDGGVLVGPTDGLAVVWIDLFQPFNAGTPMQLVVSLEDDFPNITMIGSHGTLGNPALTWANSNGSLAAPTAVVDGDYLGQVLVAGYTGSSWKYGNVSAGVLAAIVDGSVVDGSPVPVRLHVNGGVVVRPLSLTLADGLAIRTNPNDGHTYKFSVYDVNTGPAYVDWATITAGNTPSVAIAAPAGGTTLTISGLDLTTAVAPASSGTRFLCISTTGVVTSSASACSGT
jgi:hypothetical protein